MYNKAYTNATNTANRIKFQHQFSPDSLLQKMLVPGEQLVPIHPLNVATYWNEENEHNPPIHGAELRLTSNRLIVIDATKDERAFINKSEQVRRNNSLFSSGHKIFDGISYEGVPLSQITDVKLNLYNNVESSSELKQISPWLVVMGILASFVITALLWNSYWYFGVLSFMIIITLCFILQYYFGPLTSDMQHASRITIRRISPFITDKKSVHILIDVDTNKTDLGMMVEWINQLQERCPKIVNPDDGLSYRVNL